MERLFHYERSSEIRVKTSRWIHSQWRAQEHTILRVREHDPDGIGEIAEIFPLDIGTEVEATNPRNPVEHDPQTQPRWGPERKCKVRTLPRMIKNPHKTSCKL